MLSTPWSRAMELQVPIVNAPMGGVAGGRLCAAVTAAGGLGNGGQGTCGADAVVAACRIATCDRDVRNWLGGLGDPQRAGPIRCRAGRAASADLGQLRN